MEKNILIEKEDVENPVLNKEFKKLTHIKSRNQIVVAFKMVFVLDSGFKPGDYIKIIYKKNKICIVKPC